MPGLFSTRVPPPPPIPPLPETPTRDSAEVRETADAERRARMAARGRSQTILGGSTGEPIATKSLLGS